MLGLLSYSEKLELASLLQEKDRRKARNKLAGYRPYTKQREFHAAGRDHRERLLMAANQVGKTWSGGAEWAIHLSGRYPDWWEGKVFDTPVRFWAAGNTSESTRDTVQRVLVGPPQQQEMWGTGMIPGDAIRDWSSSRGTPDALNSVLVKWGGGGDVQAPESVCVFKSYEQGRQKWQGDTLHGVWNDEEPPPDIYSEGLTRTNATEGIVMTTFTPLLGMSEVVMSFLTQDQVQKMTSAKAA